MNHDAPSVWILIGLIVGSVFCVGFVIAAILETVRSFQTGAGKPSKIRKVKDGDAWWAVPWVTGSGRHDYGSGDSDDGSSGVDGD